MKAKLLNGIYKISAANIGHVVTEETKRKISIAHSAKKVWKKRKEGKL